MAVLESYLKAGQESVAAAAQRLGEALQKADGKDRGTLAQARAAALDVASALTVSMGLLELADSAGAAVLARVVDGNTIATPKAD
jgi:hypothetical protein